MTSAPGKDLDQPGRPPSLIRFFAMCFMGSKGPEASSCKQRQLSSAWADAKADLSIRWAHRTFCWFCPAAAQMHLVIISEQLFWMDLTQKKGISCFYQIKEKKNKCVGSSKALKIVCLG